MKKMKNWKDEDVEYCESKKGNVVAFVNYKDNLITSNCEDIWPPPEIATRLYKSNHEKCFECREITNELGYYCDIQSVNSEDALVWSVFGVLNYCDEKARQKYVNKLFQLVGCVEVKKSKISLWIKLPHPETFVSGGPEIDVLVSTAETDLIIEAKWNSQIAVKQGKNMNKTQMDIRNLLKDKEKVKFLHKKRIVILLGLSDADADVTWEKVCKIKEHPLYDEVSRYYEWKSKISEVNT